MARVLIIDDNKDITEMPSRYLHVKGFVKQSHRGIAGIIVTLILIAVAVVGGIAVFTFMQGFISETQVTGPSIDVVEIFGYDVSDSNDLIAHTGSIITDINVGSVDSVLGDSDAFALYLRNRGGGPVVIDKINVYGSVYTPATAATPCLAAIPEPALTEFSVSPDGTLALCGQTSIAPGEEVTIWVRYATDTNGDVALGRPIPVTVVTANGLEITKQLQNGVQVG